ncbi:hypothetical protein HanXRQr2_Chr17g0818491 [Helianthus annuus]|uniref:Uncharacterized protein n=1 Tax=Helianthus annuus TaxID=4232 RepID=A0A9K3DK17_HELAN|nr:hypothetical protein HanXRQr2_Chr17g0818491 [Helianthus annuus]KAJ0814462.1 hypothetical protein HanPSC8_Chr17g0785981 [Helianthus annuus]
MTTDHVSEDDKSVQYYAANVLNLTFRLLMGISRRSACPILTRYTT